MSDKILDLAQAVDDAKYSLDTAGRLASEMATDPETGKPIGWKEMDAVADKLAAVVNSLAGILESVASAIKQAEEYADHMSDLADGRSY